MDKIKDKSTEESFFGLRDKLFANPLERSRLHLSIAENFFILSAFLYFFSLLMTIGGSFVTYSATANFFLFPLFALSTAMLLYNICSYAITIYLEEHLVLRYVAFALCIVLFLIALGFHLGLYTFLLSLLGTK